MEKLLDRWWIQEIESSFNGLKIIITTIISVSAIIRLIYMIATWTFFNEIMSISYIFWVIALFITWKTQLSHKSKIIVALITTEALDIDLMLWAHYTKADSPFIILSTYMILVIQTQYIRSSLLVFFIGVKHIIQWYYLPIFLGLIKDTYDLKPYIVILGILLVNYKNRFHERSLEYERFAYKTQLEETKQKFFVVLQTFPDGLIVMLNDSKIELTNEKIPELLNCQQDKILETISSLLYYEPENSSLGNHFLIDDIQNSFDLDMEQEISLGIVIICNICYEWKAKKILWGSQEALILTVHSIDHIINSQQNLTEKRFKNAVFHSLSHELRTPTNAIISILEQNLGKFDEKSKERLSLANVSSKLLLSSINDMLDFSRIINGTFKPLSVNFSVRKVINELHFIIKTLAMQKNIEICCRVDPCIPNVISSDSNRLSQILLNLLNNALKFTKRGYIEVCAVLTHQNKLKFIIKDTGIGFSKNKLKWIREMLINMKVNDIGKEGLGLGLYISNMIVKQLSGSHIHIHSEQGVCTSFSFTIDIGLPIPHISTEEATLKIPSEKACPNINRYLRCRKRSAKVAKKVLLVDDNELNRAVVAAIFESVNISFLEACDGKEAVNRVTEYDKLGGFKVILMDCNMPEMDGWEATSKIIQMHNEYEINNLPVIIGYTAFTADEDVQLCYRSGMTEYIAKPASKDLLLKTIRRYLDE
ncbi:unnamed protein product [Blepharisma stoltei]|uniref:Histidine kinase n=1 Tax=Blepharisma stoltei TaxID=1481888 RepID=A0AAU9ILR6_9CILI|nr:unnamed protein product [Blepharisma stoltei]